MQNIEINTKEGTEVLEIRQGEALPLREKQKISINGRLDTVSRFLEKRTEETEQKAAHIFINRDDYTIKMVLDEASYYSGSVNGKLELSTEYKKWKLNTGSYWDRDELAKFIKENRTFFQNPSEAMVLASTLMNFEAKVNSDMKDHKDTRGNIDQHKRQVVKSNLPDSFKIEIPVFKGYESKFFEVEIEIHPGTLDAMLVSYEANDIVLSTSNKLIDDEIEKISKVCPKILIVEE